VAYINELSFGMVCVPVYMVGRQVGVGAHVMLSCGPGRSINKFQRHGCEDSDQIPFTVTQFPDFVHHFVFKKEHNIFRNWIISCPKSKGWEGTYSLGSYS
jgi:hypothetical protein